MLSALEELNTAAGQCAPLKTCEWFKLQFYVVVSLMADTSWWLGDHHKDLFLKYLLWSAFDQFLASKLSWELSK